MSDSSPVTCSVCSISFDHTCLRYKTRTGNWIYFAWIVDTPTITPICVECLHRKVTPAPLFNKKQKTEQGSATMNTVKQEQTPIDEYFGAKSFHNFVIKYRHYNFHVHLSHLSSQGDLPDTRVEKLGKEKIFELVLDEDMHQRTGFPHSIDDFVWTLRFWLAFKHTYDIQSFSTFRKETRVGYEDWGVVRSYFQHIVAWGLLNFNDYFECEVDPLILFLRDILHGCEELSSNFDLGNCDWLKIANKYQNLGALGCMNIEKPMTVSLATWNSLSHWTLGELCKNGKVSVVPEAKQNKAANIKLTPKPQK